MPDNDVKAEIVSSPPSSPVLDANGRETDEIRRYPGRVRRKPSRFNDYEMDDSG